MNYEEWKEYNKICREAATTGLMVGIGAFVLAGLIVWATLSVIFAIYGGVAINARP